VELPIDSFDSGGYSLVPLSFRLMNTKLISLKGFHSEGLEFHGFMMNLIDHIVQIIILIRPNL